MNTTNALISSFDRFMLVGARFSRITVDETEFTKGKANVELVVSIEGPDAAISKHTYNKRPVIELVVRAHALVKGSSETPDSDDVFRIECTAGFVAVDPKDDGDLDLFKTAEPQFARAVYWLVRERIQSVFSVTMLRAQTKLPWDTIEGPWKRGTESSAQTPVKKKAVTKKKSAKRA